MLGGYAFDWVSISRPASKQECFFVGTVRSKPPRFACLTLRNGGSFDLLTFAAVVLVLVTSQICGEMARWWKYHVKWTLQDAAGFLYHRGHCWLRGHGYHIIFHFSLSIVSQAPSSFSIFSVFLVLLPTVNHFCEHSSDLANPRNCISTEISNLCFCLPGSFAQTPLDRHLSVSRSCWFSLRAKSPTWQLFTVFTADTLVEQLKPHWREFAPTGHLTSALTSPESVSYNSQSHPAVL